MKEKVFSLFNVGRWEDVDLELCKVVPVLYRGPFNLEKVRFALDALRIAGSVAAPGFMNPEGVVVYHTAGNYLFKATIENDEKHKGEN